MKENTRDMTVGSPIWLLISFAIPMLIGNIFQQLYNFVDSMIVGKVVGADALAAIGATGSVTFLFFALCNGIGSGGGIITAQFFGKKEEEQIKSCIANTAYIMLAFPMVVGTIAFLLSKPLLKLLQTPENILPDALGYMRLMCIGMVLVSLYNYVSSMLRALGDSKTPLYFLIFSCILNTILDVIFVKYLHMNVLGAGIATLISQFASGICSLAYAIKYNSWFKLEKKDLRINKSIMRSIIRLGVPLSLQFSMIAVSSMVLQRVVNSFGAVAVAAFTTTNRIEQVIHQPYITLGTALSTFTGQNYGANKKERLVMGYRRSLLLMVFFTIIMVPVMQLFGNQITSLFVSDPAVIAMGGHALRITSFFYLFLGVIYVIRGVLNGVGDSFFALLNGVIEVIFRSLLPVLFVMIPALGVWGIWWAVGVVWLISGFTAWLRYLKFRPN